MVWYSVRESHVLAIHRIVFEFLIIYYFIHTEAEVAHLDLIHP